MATFPIPAWMCLIWCLCSRSSSEPPPSGSSTEILALSSFQEDAHTASPWEIDGPMESESTEPGTKAVQPRLETIRPDS